MSSGIMYAGIYGGVLFLALVALLKWKHHRVGKHQRMSRGLRSYVSTEVSTNVEETLKQ